MCEKPFVIRFNYGSGSSTDYNFLPRDSVRVFTSCPFQFEGDPTFDTLYGDISKENRTVSLLSEDGKVLKTWSVKGKDAGGRQLFQESFWRKYQDGPTPEASGIHAVWVFDVIPEDIEAPPGE